MFRSPRASRITSPVRCCLTYRTPIDETFRGDKDKEIGRVGFEINFNRFSYKYVPPRCLGEIDSELRQVEKEIAELLGEVTE